MIIDFIKNSGVLNITGGNIQIDKEVIVKKGTVITKEILENIKPYFMDGYGVKEVTINEELDTYNKIQEILEKQFPI